MEWLDGISQTLLNFMPMLVVLAVTGGILTIVKSILKRRWRDLPDLQFRFQLIMLTLTLTGILALLLVLPVSDSLRGQLLGLTGILLSAAIALSSTTFIGNIMAGIMLKAIRSIRPGDFLTVADVTGRVTEMALLHTEIQSEDRDLVTVPNLYMVTQPMKVVRASGTIISAEVSLGYEIPRTRVSTILREAAGKAGLTDTFIHVRNLGDYSVNYRIAGLLEDVKSLISVRSHLREEMLDGLHGAGIEIVSPNFMNTRVVAQNQSFIPPVTGHSETVRVSQEEVAFDKAEVAASVDDIRVAIEAVEAELREHEKDRPKDADTENRATAPAERLETKKALLIEQLKQAETLRKSSEDPK